MNRPPVSFRYDNGLQKVYTYDDGDRVKALTVRQGGATELDERYEYDAAGRLTAISSGGVRSTYEYDSANRLICEENGLTGVITRYGYTPSGALKWMRTYENGELVSYAEYEYDAIGNEIYKDEDGEITTYVYDSLSRLTTAVMPGDVLQHYEHDDYGNIESLTKIHGSEISETMYYYNDANRLLYESCEADGTESRYEYDAAGNLVYKEAVTRQNGVTASEETAYRYNGSGQLVMVTDPTGDLYEYSYYPGGLRYGKTAPDETTGYVYEAGKIIMETDGAGYVTAKNTWGSRLLSRETQDAVYSYRFNGHGDVTALTDERGDVLEDYTYDPYGNEMTAESEKDYYLQAAGEAYDNPFHYCGEYLDAETGAYYLRARYYDPTIGRFLSEDPARDGANWYVYCSNNPIVFIDPCGMETIALRSTIEGLGGTVIWDPNTNTATVSLDGQSTQVSAGDNNGSYIENNSMYTDDGWLFIALGTKFDLGKGWEGRIERHGSGSGFKKHVHIYKGEQEWMQNEDGSPHDDNNNSPGSPPNSTLKKLKDLEDWDWKQKEQDWLNRIEINYDPAGGAMIRYPNGRTVRIYKQLSYFPTPYSLSKQDLRNYFYGPTYIDLRGGNSVTNPSTSFLPFPNFVPGSLPIPLPAPIPVPVLP